MSCARPAGPLRPRPLHRALHPVLSPGRRPRPPAPRGQQGPNPPSPDHHKARPLVIQGDIMARSNWSWECKRLPVWECQLMLHAALDRPGPFCPHGMKRSYSWHGPTAIDHDQTSVDDTEKWSWDSQKRPWASRRSTGQLLWIRRAVNAIVGRIKARREQKEDGWKAKTENLISIPKTVQ